MDNLFVLILFLAGVGAIVGAATNYLAIKMLFRPHNPIYFMKWRLPLTPGLIPKRRDMLAIQLGKTVTEYLLTPATIKKKFLSDEVRQNVLQFAQQKVEQEIFLNDKTLKDWLDLTGFGHLPATVEGKVDVIIYSQFENVKHVLSTKKIQEILPADLEPVLDRKISEAVGQILQKGEDYFLSPEGYMTIRNMLDDFLSSKGSIGGMIQMFMGDSSSLVEKVQRELVKFLQAPGTSALLNRIFLTEWEKVKERPAMDFMKDINFDRIAGNIQEYAKRELALDERLDKRIQDYWPQGNDWAKNELLPKLLNKVFIEAENKIEDVLQRLNLAEVVREQVDSFPTAKLEELVLGIISKELRLITWLGGIIGGLVGIVQAFIVFFTN
ncbi:DUF445 domain-containing protein [Lysinibacillus odysseyi]|uniref:Membrane protein n=1 Tax=Lysinibacillus odysseyi 34hs-1 = NBRC 100172 TaxID=1220589 RepID=A0A0A3IDP3_9BACI|nr:DUF445 family protein [Lysinibacillus odysseyi]KGR82881.1 membrane protein [Lysinibacillus odysseyi 34hs-1 = NBRC 100172]